MIFQEMIVDVKSCQRCGYNHENLRFYPLTNPADEWAWWATCPEVGQPLLLSVYHEDEQEQQR